MSGTLSRFQRCQNGTKCPYRQALPYSGRSALPDPSSPLHGLQRGRTPSFLAPRASVLLPGAVPHFVGM